MKRILIVEDDTYLRDLYKELLETEGYTVEVGVDGEEGLVKAAAGGYDLILLDVMMPKLNGLEMLSELKKKHVEKPNGAIILLTNLGHDPIVHQAMDEGAQDFLVKSDITPGEFVQKVKAFLG